MEISLPVTLAVLGAALLHASWNAMLKAGEDKSLDTIAIAVGTGAVGLAVAPWLQAPAPASWPWLAASALVHILYFLFLAGAYRWGELSFTYPVMRGGGPVLVAVFGAAVMGEILSAWQTLGVALICAGILGFAAGRFAPRALGFALGNAAIIAAYTLIDAQGARASGSPVAYALWLFFATGVAVYAAGGARRAAAVPRHFARHRMRLAAGALCVAGAYAIAIWAMTRAPVALVAVLRETSVIFAAALGALFLGERFTRRRLLATGAVLAGLAALRF